MKIIIATERDLKNTNRYGYGIEICQRGSQTFEQNIVETTDPIEAQLKAVDKAISAIPSHFGDKTLAFFIEPESAALLQDEKSENPIYNAYLNKIHTRAKENDYEIHAFDIMQHKDLEIYRKYKTAKSIAQYYTEQPNKQGSMRITKEVER